LTEDTQWQILLVGAAFRVYGPAALLIALSLLARRRWKAETPLTPSPEGTDRKNWTRHGGITALLAVAATTAIFVFVSLRRGPLMWDESVFVYKAYRVSEGLRHLSPSDAWTSVATGDRLYPPASAFILGTVFAVLGSSQNVALACTAFGFVAAAALLFAIGCYLDGKRGPTVGLIAVLLLLSSPLLLEYAGTDMLEVAGIDASLLSMVAYLWHLRRSSEITALVTGLALALTFFTKYNYGLFAIAPVAVCQLSLGRWQPWRRENLWLWVPVAVLADLWFTIEGKWEGFVGFATNHDSGMPMLSQASLLFYPRYFFTEYTSSVVLGILTILAGFGAIAWVKKIEVRFILLFFAIGFGGMTIHHLKADRYIATVVPALFLLSAFAFVKAYERITPRWAQYGTVGFGVLLIIPTALIYVKGLPKLVTRERPIWSAFPWPYRDLYSATGFALIQIDPKVPTTFTGVINEWSPEYIRWQFEMTYPRSKMYVDHLEKGRLNFISLQLLPGSPYLSPNYYEYNARNDADALRRMQPQVKSGVRSEAVFPREGLKIVVIKDAEALR